MIYAYYRNIHIQHGDDGMKIKRINMYIWKFRQLYQTERIYSPAGDIIEVSTPCGIGVDFNDASVKIQK